MKNGRLSRTPGRQSWSALSPDQISRLTTALDCVLFLSANQYTGIELIEPLIIPRQGFLSIAENTVKNDCCIIRVNVYFVFDATYILCFLIFATKMRKQRMCFYS